MAPYKGRSFGPQARFHFEPKDPLMPQPQGLGFRFAGFPDLAGQDRRPEPFVACGVFRSSTSGSKIEGSGFGV